MRYQRGSQRSGVQEWRSNTFEFAVNKADRVAAGEDPDNTMKEGGWVTVDAKDAFGSWRPLYSVAGVGVMPTHPAR